jgi:DNA replicative helicase MCM subunit Mcm2 (Cdc46/Mcm family)
MPRSKTRNKGSAMKRVITKKEIEKLDKAIRRDTGTEADAENIERMLYNYMYFFKVVQRIMEGTC